MNKSKFLKKMSSFFFSNHEADSNLYQKVGNISIDTCEPSTNIYLTIQQKAVDFGRDGVSNLKITSYKSKDKSCVLASGDLLKKKSLLKRCFNK